MSANVVSGAFVGSMALGEMNANLLDGSYSESTSDTDLFADWEIQRARILTDSELYDDIAAQPSSDFWAQLATDSPELAWGAKLGDAGTFKYQGALGLVEVKFSDGSWRPAHEHAELAQLTRWKFGPLYTGLGEDIYGRHCITPDRRIYFLGVAARLRYVPEYEFDEATFLHRCPERTTAAQIRGTIAKLYKDGVDASMIEYHQKQYAADRDAIKAGRAAVADFLSYRNFQRQQQQAA
jgi:hypothetical protein